MAFDLNIWKKQAAENLRGWKARLVGASMNTAYVAVAAGVLAPLLAAYQQGDLPGVYMALGSVLTGLSTNLLSTQIQKWKDEADIIAQLGQTVASDPALRAEVDAVLDKLDALALARDALSAAERDWFVETLRRELTQLGNLEKFHAVLSGAQNIIQQGDSNVLHVAYVNHTYHLYQNAPGKAALNDAAFRQVLERYLRWVSDAYSKARLYGRESLPTTRAGAQRDLGGVFVPLSLRRFNPPLEREVETTARKLSGELTRERANLQLMELARGKGRDVPLRELLRQGNQLAIIGGAGSGKSTLLAYLAATLAAAPRTGRTPPFALPDGRQLPVPMLIPLRYFREYQEHCKRASGDYRLRDARTGTLAGFIPWYLKRRSPALETSEDFFDRLLLGRGCLLMLDGLDEIVSTEERGQIRQQVEDLVNDIYPGNIVVVTARAAGYRENAVFGDPFTRLDVQPLAEEQIAALVGNWYDQLYAPDEAPARAAELTGAIAGINQLRADKDLPPLINTPLMTTMVVSVKWGETELPRERARLY
ncbi:MAG: NACHT domain-containing protein, partial [Anaerolineales bacterium]